MYLVWGESSYKGLFFGLTLRLRDPPSKVLLPRLLIEKEVEAETECTELSPSLLLVEPLTRSGNES
jgi:hypothetical protein